VVIVNFSVTLDMGCRRDGVGTKVATRPPFSMRKELYLDQRSGTINC